MTYTLFIDDIRTPTHDLGDPKCAINVSEAIEIVIKNGVPSCISFDHDLGEDEPSAMEFMKWLIEGHLEAHHDLNLVEKIIIHSANPPGAKNLQGLWDNFSNVMLDKKIQAILRPR